MSRENRLDGYELLDESQIPKCCGSCIFIRYSKYDLNASNKNPFCKIIEDTVCVFGRCYKYRPNRLIFIKGV